MLTLYNCMKSLKAIAAVGASIGIVVGGAILSTGVWQNPPGQSPQERVITHGLLKEKRDCFFCDPIDPAGLPVYNLPTSQVDVYCVNKDGVIYGGPEVHAESGEKLFIRYDEVCLKDGVDPNAGYDLLGNRPDRLPLTCSDMGTAEPVTLAVCPPNFIKGDEKSLSNGTGCLSVGTPDAVFTYNGKTITDATVYPPMVKAAPMRVVAKDGNTR